MITMHSWRPAKPRAILMALLAATSVIGLAGSDHVVWNEFRGPGGTGVRPSSTPLIRLGVESLAWKSPLPSGMSSPVLSRDRVFLTAIDEGRLVTLAFDTASGRQAWRREAPEVPIETVHRISSPAVPTPLVDAERVIVYFGSFGLLCYDHDGEQLWRKPIPIPKSLCGTATSPIAHGDNLILVLDNDANLPDSELSQSRVMALYRTTGETEWETARPLFRSGWSTPTIWRLADGEDLVVLGSGRVCGYDPASGVEKWFVTEFPQETITRPVTGAGHVYVASAMGGRGTPLPVLEPRLGVRGEDGRRLSNSPST